jgi:hypothetical protein
VSPPIHPLTSSQGAVFLVNSCQGYFRCAPTCVGEALFRSYGCFFAEFLGGILLVRLALLELTTCVGLRYGSLHIELRRFSWKALRKTPPLARSRTDARGPHLSERPGFSWNAPLVTHNANPIMHSSLCPPSLHRICRKLRNINRMSIRCGFRHPLRTD